MKKLLSPRQTAFLRRLLRKADARLERFRAQGEAAADPWLAAVETELRALVGSLPLDRPDEQLLTVVDRFIDAKAAEFGLAVERRYARRLSELGELRSMIEPHWHRIDLLHEDAARHLSLVDDAATHATKRLADRDVPPTGPRSRSRRESERGEAQSIAHGEFDELVGRPRTHALFWLVVLAAAGADIATFDQVLVLVLNLPGSLVWAAVVGFTATALTLAHHAGQKARQVVGPRHVAGSATVALAAGTVWLTLGLLAFAVRYVIADSAASGTGSITIAGGPSVTPTSGIDLTSQHLAALMFLGLYVATGFVTGLGGFMRIDPAVRQYARARSERAKTAHALSTPKLWLLSLGQRLTEITEAQKRIEQERDKARDLAESVAEQLKAKAHIQLLNRRAPATAPAMAPDEQSARLSQPVGETEAEAGAEETHGAEEPEEAEAPDSSALAQGSNKSSESEESL